MEIMQGTPPDDKKSLARSKNELKYQCDNLRAELDLSERGARRLRTDNRRLQAALRAEKEDNAVLHQHLAVKNAELAFFCVEAT